MANSLQTDSQEYTSVQLDTNDPPVMTKLAIYIAIRSFLSFWNFFVFRKNYLHINFYTSLHLLINILLHFIFILKNNIFFF